MAFPVQIGVNPISWMNDDLPSLGGETPLETALAEGKRIGYRGFELGNKFPREPAALRAVLAAHGLSCVSGWYSGRLAGRSAEDEIRAVEPHLRLLADSGASVLVYGEVQDAIQGEIAVPLGHRPRFRDADAWKAYGERVTALGRHLLRAGVRLAYHHHMGAYVQGPDDIDTLMAVTGDEVGLLLDTGHAVFGGGDPAALARRHAARICHVHCKDVRPRVIALARNRAWSFLTSVMNGVFTVPGDGSGDPTGERPRPAGQAVGVPTPRDRASPIDFHAVLGVLHQAGYRGWLVVEAEQDPAVAPSYACGDQGFRHIDRIVRALDAETVEAV